MKPAATRESGGGDGRSSDRWPTAAWQSTFGWLPQSVRRRLAVLAAGNALLLSLILAVTLRNEKASFADELRRLAPNVAPHVLAGLGLTGIILAGAIDLSIGSIVVVAATVRRRPSPDLPRSHSSHAGPTR